MSKIFNLITVCTAILSWQTFSFAQKELRQPTAGPGQVFNVDYRSLPANPLIYTDDGGPGANYSTATAPSVINTFAEFRPVGVGTFVRVEFTDTDIEKQDTLFVYEDNTRFKGNETDTINDSLSVAPPSLTYIGSPAAAGGPGRISFVWFEDGANAAKEGWKANVDLVNAAGAVIPNNYNWVGFTEGNGQNFIFNPGMANEAFVFCGFDASVRWVMDEDLTASGQTFEFRDRGSYKQRLDSVIVDWGDGSPIDTFDVDEVANRNAYDANGRSIFNTPSHPYTLVGRYTITMRGIDEIGVESQSQTFDIIIEGDDPTSVTAPDVEVCIGDPATMTSDVEWIVDDYNARILNQRWEGPSPSNPNGPDVVLKNGSPGDNFLNINPNAYPAPADGGPAFFDYTFTHYVTFDNGCGEVATPINYRVYKLPNAGDADPNADNEVCEDLADFDLNTLLDPASNPDPDGTWTDQGGNVIANGIVSPMPAPGSYTYRYTVTNPQCPSDQDEVTLVVLRNPYAGTNDGTSISNPLKLCVDQQNVDLFNLLDGDPSRPVPDINGQWYLVEGATETPLNSPQINSARFLDASEFGVNPPTASKLFQLCYEVVDETGECSPTRECVFVRIYPEPYVVPTTVDTQVCENDPIIVMDNLVDDAFRTSGNWQNYVWPAAKGGPVSNQAFFEPNKETVPGIYKFRKYYRNPDNQGNDICRIDSIVVTVEFFLKPEAGPDANYDICPSQPIDLYDTLLAAADTDGQFFGPLETVGNVPTANPNAFQFDTDGGTFTFRYMVTGDGPCPDDEATLTFNVSPFKDAGMNNSILACTADGPRTIITELNGTPDNGGTWSPTLFLTGTSENARFNASAAGAGTYTYTYSFPKTGECPAVSSQLTIEVYNEPNSGNAFAETICNVDNSKNQYFYSLANQISGPANGAVNGNQPQPDVMEEFGAIQANADAVTNSVTGLVNVENLGGGTYDFFYRTFNAGCDADTAFFKITVNQVGNAGKDSLFVRCSDEPVLNMRDFIGPNADQTGTWEDTDGSGGLEGALFNATFNPGNVEQQSPDTGFRHIYIVEVPECPDDSASVVAYVSKKLESGVAKGGDDSLLYACEDENAVNLLNAFVPNSFDEPMGNPDRPLYGRWKLVKPNGGYLVPQQVLDEVNINDRERFFGGADSSEFDIEEFVKYWEGEETIQGSRTYNGGVNNLSFWQWLKTDRLLYFEYTVRDTSIGKLKIPTYYEGTSTSVPREISCGTSSSVINVALMPDYDKRFTLEVDPNGEADITICNSITDLDLKQYFNELRLSSKLDIRDIFNPTFDTIVFNGIPGTPDPITDGTIYNMSPSQPFFLDVSRLDPSFPKPPVPASKTPYNIRLEITSGKDTQNKCGRARSQIGLRLNVEKIPQPGGGPGPGSEPLTEYSICEGSPTFNMHDQITGDKDPYDPNRHFFTAVSTNANGRILGQNFRMTGANPNLYIVRYNIPTVACVNPVVSSVNDPGRNNNPKNFSSLLEITVTSGPDLDGFDAQVNEFDVCSDPVTNLGDLFPVGNNIDQSGEFTILTSGCGAIDNADDWNNATYNRNNTNCSSVLIQYEVVKGDCPPATLQIRLNLTEKPYPGENAKDTICVNNGLYDLFELLAKNQIPGKTIDRDGVFKGRKASTDNAINLGGFFDPNAAGVGTHTVVYTVGDGAICELDSAVLNIKVNKIERAGSDGQINACAGSPKLDLFDGLSGNFSSIGYFIPCNDDLLPYMEGAKDQIFNHTRYRTLEEDPQSQVCFKYVIDALCYNDTATILVNLTPGPVSGGDTTIFICEDLFEYNLFDALGVQDVDWLPAGIWRGVAGTPGPSYDGFNEAFIGPRGLGRGTFRYDYTVEAECADTVRTSTSRVTVKIGDNISAGEDTTRAVCYSGIINLDIFFGVNGAGTWLDTFKIGGLVDENQFDLDQTNDDGEADTYTYAYVVPETYENCTPAVAFYTIDVRKQPNAGRDTTVFYCNVAGQEFPALDLFPDRSSNQKLFPSAGISAAGALSGGVFFPDRLAAGNYNIRLIITDSECGKDTAVANIFIQDKDDPNSILCGDFDDDGVRNNEDLDVDGDGISNNRESRVNGGNRNPFGNHDNDELLNFQDPDYAASIGSFMRLAVVAAFDFDADGLINALDLDSDNDNIPDIVEAFGAENHSGYDGNSDGKTDDFDALTGISAETKDLVPNSFSGSEPYDYLNIDSDGDGISDKIEVRSNNDLEGTTWIFAPVNTDVDANNGYDYLDLDSDDDGISDSKENVGGSLFVVINSNANPGPGIVTTDNAPDFRDTDSDGDGILDRREAYMDNFGNLNDFDGDGLPNVIDVDSDNDGIADFIEKGPIEIPRNTDAEQTSSFSVSDTLPDFIDFDADGDGILDAIERGNSTFGQALTLSNVDGDTRADYRDLDSDGDRIPDALEINADGTLLDTDMDGNFNFREVDSDGDGYLDANEAIGGTSLPDTITTSLFVDFDFDGIPDFLDFDSDDDGIEDRYEVNEAGFALVSEPFDNDGDGIADFHDLDSDEDGLLDEQERGEGDEGTTGPPRDSDEDGIYDFREIDADGDGIIDRLEGDGDCDGDGIENYRDAGDQCKIETYVPEGFSPNGDRINDFFVIPDAEFFPGNTLRVYNRWGALVFEMENYDNTWDGTDEGDVLPDGTYFYTFDLGIGQEALTGYVFISRN